MRKAALVLHCTMAVVLTGLCVSLWGLEIFTGDGPWFSWGRDIRFMGIYADMYAMVLISIVLIPGMIITDWHALTLLGYARPRASLQHMSNLIAAFSIGILTVVGVRFQIWREFAGSKVSSLPAPPSDEKLAYPELPLKTQDAAAWEMEDLSGKKISLAELKGKAVFLNFWATWCGYCKAEFPNIQRLNDALKDNPNIALVLVTEEKPEVVKKWLESEEGKPFNLPFYITKEIPEAYAPSGWPTTYILAPDGRVAFRHSGFAAWDGEKTKAFLAKLAAH